jgi:AhpC/TSA family
VNAFLVGSYVALWALVAVLAAAVLALYNHFGSMYLSSREGRAAQGPAVGSRLTPFDAATLDGRAIAVPSGRPVLLVLASTDCPECERLKAPLQRLAGEHRDQLDVVVVCGGRGAAVAEWAASLRPPVDVVADKNFKRAAALGVGITPFVVGVDGMGVVRARGLVNGADGIGWAVDDLLDAGAAEVSRTPVIAVGVGASR